MSAGTRRFPRSPTTWVIIAGLCLATSVSFGATSAGRCPVYLLGLLKKFHNENKGLSEAFPGKKIPYLTAEEAAARVITERGGIFYDAQGIPVQGSGLFVWVRGKLMFQREAGMPENFHHSSFTAGEPVVTAGHLTFDKEGRLVAISSSSGHYQTPPANLGVLLNHLARRKVPLEKVRVNFFDWDLVALNASELVGQITPKETTARMIVEKLAREGRTDDLKNRAALEILLKDPKAVEYVAQVEKLIGSADKTLHYNAVLALARSGNKAAAERADALLLDLLKAGRPPSRLLAIANHFGKKKVTSETAAKISKMLAEREATQTNVVTALLTTLSKSTVVEKDRATVRKNLETFSELGLTLDRAQKRLLESILRELGPQRDLGLFPKEKPELLEAVLTQNAYKVEGLQFLAQGTRADVFSGTFTVSGRPVEAVAKVVGGEIGDLAPDIPIGARTVEATRDLLSNALRMQRELSELFPESVPKVLGKITRDGTDDGQFVGYLSERAKGTSLTELVADGTVTREEATRAQTALKERMVAKGYRNPDYHKLGNYTAEVSEGKIIRLTLFDFDAVKKTE